MKYDNGKETVDAVQWFKVSDHPKCHRNMIWGTSVCERCGNHSGKHAWIGTDLICEGDWIITRYDGKIDIMSDDKFKRFYKEVK